MTRIVVDLPAPFGPAKPVTRPGEAVKVIPFSASGGPYRLRSLVRLRSRGPFYAGPGCQRGPERMTPG